MLKNTVLLLFILFKVTIIQAQNKTENTFIEYETYQHSKQVENENGLVLIANNQASLLTKLKDLTRIRPNYPIEEFLYQHTSNKAFSLTQLNQQKRIGTEIIRFENETEFKHTDKTKSILGYKCHLATTTINSNKLEIWYTKELQQFGSPIKTGASLGVVLEIKRNNDFKITAKKITRKIPFDFESLAQSNQTPLVDELTYHDIIWKNRFTTLAIFDNEIINYTQDPKSNDSIFRFAHGTVLVRKVAFPKITSSSQVFLDLSLQSNGDAYDRTGSVFIIPTFQDQNFLEALKKGIEQLPIYKTKEPYKNYQGVVATPDYTPLMELMRFFTPFGIQAFNHIQLKNHNWQESAFYRQEVSEFIPLLQNRTWYIGVYIGNYDEGGHKITANLTIHNSEVNEPKTSLFMPLFNTTNIMEMAGQEYPTMFNAQDGLSVTFTLDESIENAFLRYITTGHGGRKNGDEFNPKSNEIYLDGQLTHSFIPWRQDCGSYRLYNPASGNFTTGLSSSDLSRSNWCPGTITNPYIIPLGKLEAGEHTLKVKIKQGKPEGKSFSYWNVSGILTGY